MSSMVILDGYEVKRTTDSAILLAKVNAAMEGEGTWVPRAWCRDGDALEEGDTDIEIIEGRAVDKELDF